MKTYFLTVCCIAVFNNNAMNPRIDWQTMKTEGSCLGILNESSVEKDVIPIANNWYATYFLSFFDKPVFADKGRGYDDSYDGTYRVNSCGLILNIWLNNKKHFKDRLYKEIVVADRATYLMFTFSPVGYLVATYTHYDYYYYNPTIKVWDIVTGDCLKEIKIDNRDRACNWSEVLAFRKITWLELLGQDILWALVENLCPDLNSLQQLHERMTGKLALIKIKNS